MRSYFSMFSLFKQSTVVGKALCRTNRLFSVLRPISYHESISSKKSFFITTPIYYVNGLPHIGHAYTSVSADVIARFQRLCGKEVLFITGTDEHGLKVQQSACAAQEDTACFSSSMSSKFLELGKTFGISNNDFIRTTDMKHKETVVKMWKKLVENDEIYLGFYEGWYSVRDEAYYADDEVMDGVCISTGSDVEWMKESSYFFRLSKYGDRLLAFYEENPEFILPVNKRNEMISFLKSHKLHDLSISRTTFSWGIPVPDDPSHVIYVWLDALMNYATGADYSSHDSGDDMGKFAQFWPPDVQVIGKDILKFHTMYWPALLMAADFPLPQHVFAHGWWTSSGQKMSKSVGNVVDPFALVAKYGLDPVRYFLISAMQFGNDGDFSEADIVIKANSHLSNDFGNLIHRVSCMIEKHCGSKIPTYHYYHMAQSRQPSLDICELDVCNTGQVVLSDEDKELLVSVEEVYRSVCDCMTSARGFDLHKVCDLAMGMARLGNQYFNRHAPWTLCKSPDTMPRLRAVLFTLTETIRVTAILLSPVIPDSSDTIMNLFNIPASNRTLDSLLWFKKSEDIILGGIEINKPVPIFPRMDVVKAAVPVAKKKKSSARKNPTTSSKIKADIDNGSAVLDQMSENSNVRDKTSKAVSHSKSSPARRERIPQVGEAIGEAGPYSWSPGATSDQRKWYENESEVRKWCLIHIAMKRGEAQKKSES